MQEQQEQQERQGTEADVRSVLRGKRSRHAELQDRMHDFSTTACSAIRPESC